MTRHPRVLLIGLVCLAASCGLGTQEEPVVVDIYCSVNLTGETPAETVVYRHRADADGSPEAYA